MVFRLSALQILCYRRTAILILTHCFISRRRFPSFATMVQTPGRFLHLSMLNTLYVVVEGEMVYSTSPTSDDAIE